MITVSSVSGHNSKSELGKSSQLRCTYTWYSYQTYIVRARWYHTPVGSSTRSLVYYYDYGRHYSYGRLAGRASYSTAYRTVYLNINEVNAADDGNYRCELTGNRYGYVRSSTLTLTTCCKFEFSKNIYNRP